MRIVLGLEYCGMGFCGWQSQLQGCGVQDALETAVAVIAGVAIRIIAAGRTDTGVHAAFQVVHFDTEVDRPLTAWVRGVNSHLPPGVAVQWARELDNAFHARFSANQRGYRYVLLNHAVRPGLNHGLIGWYHRPLDVDAMNAAAARLIGLHDFSAFRAAACQSKSPTKDLRLIKIERRGDYLLCDFLADGFLHHMVRNLMGCLIQVGAGARSAEWAQSVLESRDRSFAAPTFDPAGLYLTHIRYPAHFGLPETPERWLYA
ncbi:MAG: tRNA pseudouridine(38-40) synthase TruA [Thiobacillus sp.]